MEICTGGSCEGPVQLTIVIVYSTGSAMTRIGLPGLCLLHGQGGQKAVLLYGLDND